MPLYLASSYKPKKILDATGPVLVSSFHRWKVQLYVEECMVQREHSWREHSNLPIFIQFSQCLNKKRKIIWFHLIFGVYFYTERYEIPRMLHSGFSFTELSTAIKMLVNIYVCFLYQGVKSVFRSMFVKADPNKIDYLAEEVLAFP